MPKAIGDFLILDAIRASGGTAVAVTDDELIAAVGEIGAADRDLCRAGRSGLSARPAKTDRRGLVNEGETVVIFNTGSGVKYLEALGQASKPA